MTDVDRLLREYIERFESGGSADPNDLLERTEGTDRAKLATLIEGFLEHAARPQPWDPDAFEGSVAERAVARVSESWSEATGALPLELVKLRNERQITRANLITRLADSLGASGAREKVAFYYHRMERGLLPAEGIAAKVWDSLADLLGTSADSLRELGSATPSPAASERALYARTAPPPPEEYRSDQAADQVGAGMPSPGRGKAEEPDEVDRLFTGGS